MSGFDLSKECFDQDYCVAGDGVWIVGERHAFGGAKHIFPDVNNRGFVFKVKNCNGEEHLLLNGIPGSSCIPKVKKVEEDTGLKVTIVVGSGDFHHLAMKDWLDAFPDVQFIQSGLKFPTTRNGKEILENEEWKSRITLVNGPDFPMLEQYRDTVRFFGFNQFMTGADKPFTSKDNKNPTKEPFFKFLKQFASVKPEMKFLAVWTYHVPTKQLIYEHNFNFFLTKEHLKTFPLPFRLALPKEKICSCAKEKLPTGPTDPEDCKKHCELMAQVLDLDVRGMIEYHSLPGVMAGRWDSKEHFHEEFTKILKKTGEHVADGSAMAKKMSSGDACVIM